MDVQIDPQMADMIAEAVEDGRYASPARVVKHAMQLWKERERKFLDLRATINASIARGGSHTDEEVGRHLEERRQLRTAKRAGSA